MVSNPNFDETAAAYAQVQKAVTQLRAEYESVCAEIETTEAELKAAPLAFLPLDDLKAAILEFIDASGARYAAESVKGAISSFSTHGMSGIGGDTSLHGKPLRYCDIEQCMAGVGAGGMAQLMTPSKHQFNDQVFYYFFGQLVKEGLTKLMDEMPPNDFGYGAIHPDKVGSDRATRRATIDGLRKKLEELSSRRDELKAKLLSLGCGLPTMKGAK